jgi:hypothetical protein
VRTASTADGSGSAQTSDERRAAIDRQLDDSLGTFDATLRKEQERVAKERDARQAGAQTTSEEGTTSSKSTADASARKVQEGSNSTDEPDKDSDSGKKDGGRPGRSDQRTARSGDLKSDKGSTGANASGGNGALATKIPDGSDDDVVARRLRKAAEQETDPELKEKLWQEYVEYKKSAQG